MGLVQGSAESCQSPLSGGLSTLGTRRTAKGDPWNLAHWAACVCWQAGLPTAPAQRISGAGGTPSHVHPYVGTLLLLPGLTLSFWNNVWRDSFKFGSFLK